MNGLLLIWIAPLALAVLWSIKKIDENEIGVIFRFGRPFRVTNPGLHFVLPFLDHLQRVSVEPFSVSLPPQSAITKDEIPIQLQASMDAVLRKPELAAVKARDWRVSVMSLLQELMKDRLEELDFDRLDQAFPSWIESIRASLVEKAEQIGVEVTGLKISNLSPRTRPSE